MSLSDVDAESALVGVFEEVGHPTELEPEEVGLGGQDGGDLGLAIEGGGDLTGGELLLVAEGHVGLLGGGVPLQVGQQGGGVVQVLGHRQGQLLLVQAVLGLEHLVLVVPLGRVGEGRDLPGRHVHKFEA